MKTFYRGMIIFVVLLLAGLGLYFGFKYKEETNKNRLLQQELTQAQSEILAKEAFILALQKEQKNLKQKVEVHQKELKEANEKVERLNQEVIEIKETLLNLTQSIEKAEGPLQNNGALAKQKAEHLIGEMRREVEALVAEGAKEVEETNSKNNAISMALLTQKYSQKIQEKIAEYDQKMKALIAKAELDAQGKEDVEAYYEKAKVDLYQEMKEKVLSIMGK